MLRDQKLTLFFIIFWSLNGQSWAFECYQDPTQPSRCIGGTNDDPKSFFCKCCDTRKCREEKSCCQGTGKQSAEEDSAMQSLTCFKRKNSTMLKCENELFEKVPEGGSNQRGDGINGEVGK